MNRRWHDSLRLTMPVREVRLARVVSAADARQEEIDRRERAAYERGRIEGERALSELLVRQRQETQEVLQGVVQSLRHAVPQVVRDTEQTLVALAIEIARKVVGELPFSVERVEAVVRETLAQIENATELTVRLHPADLELLEHLPSPLLTAEGGRQTLRFVASPEVTRGGCLVQTRFGTLDARTETKFDLLKRSLLP